MSRWTKSQAMLGAAIVGVGLSSACGMIIDNRDHKDDTTPAAGALTPPAPLTEPDKTDSPKLFDGYVGGTFAVTVDGAAYADMEDFYTKELQRLPQKVKAAGYDDSWQPKFDAQLGYSDLWRNMTVYIAPVQAQGFQGQTTVEDSGHFSVTLPATAVEHDYKVKATKRIDILLTRGETAMKICYNFSAVEQSVPFHHDSLPIVLNTFASTVTAYACELAADDGLSIPDSPAKPLTVGVGETKSDVARILGLDGLFAQAPTQWCWAFRKTADSPCASHRDGSPCDCSVTFDDKGIVTALDGVAPTYLKTP